MLLIRVRATHIELLESHSNIFETIGTYGPKDIAPNISMPIKGDVSSTTKSAIVPGTIDIRENPAQNISALSRDTKNALNELGRIFDKRSIEEQKELVNVFREEAFRLAHNIKDDRSGRKIIVHAAIAGLMSQITGAGFASGAVGAGLNEALIKNLKGKDPGTAQIVSAIIGAAAAKVAGGSAAAGASATASGTKNNVALLAAVPEVAEVAAVASTQAPRIIPLIKGLGEAISKMGCVIAVVEGVQYIREIGTNEIVAQLQQDGTWLFNKTYSALESVFKEHNIPYSQPQTLSGSHFYITPPITVTPPDNERFPFDLSPNILDIKYKPRTNPLLDFKEQWSQEGTANSPRENIFFSNNGNLTPEEIIKREKKGSIRQVFPGQWLGKPLREIEAAAKKGDASARTAKKLLKDKRFDKNDNRK